MIAGGAAWGEGSHRATRLGADLRLDDPAELADGLQTVWGTSLAEPLPSVSAEALLLVAAPPELLVIALERQCAANPWMRGMRPTGGAADTTGVPAAAVLESGYCLADSIEADAPTAAEMLRGEASSALDEQVRRDRA